MSLAIQPTLAHSMLPTQPGNDPDECFSSERIIPLRFDVLFGRGNSRNHSGNRRVQIIVEMHRERYERAGRYGKTEIAERVVDIVRESGGRFLKLDDEGNGWVEVDHAIAREKVSKFFRRKRDNGLLSFAIARQSR